MMNFSQWIRKLENAANFLEKADDVLLAMMVSSTLLTMGVGVTSFLFMWGILDVVPRTSEYLAAVVGLGSFIAISILDRCWAAKSL